jgi:ATP synthase F1 delta subunit
VSTLGERLGEVARELVQQAAHAVDLAGVKDVLEAIEHHGEGERLEAEVTSAVALTESERAVLEGRLKARHGADLPIHFKVDPAILGGLIVRVGDRMVDGSVATKLGQLRQTITG